MIFFNNKITKSKIAFLSLSIGLLLFSGCKRPDEGLDVIINVGTLVKAPVLVKFSNANKTVTTQIPDFDVTITGQDSALVQMDGGGRKFVVSHGFLPLTMTSKAVPSKTKPLTFNVTANPAGFAPVTRTIEISSDTTSIIELDLVQYSNPPKGTSALVSSLTLKAGVMSATTIKTPSNSTMPESATLTIQEGTQIRDAKGSLINANSLQYSIVQYSANTPSNLAAFPGGLEAPLALDDRGKPIPGGVKFITAGLLAINMTANNITVKSFSKPISMSIDLPAITDNYNTGKTIAVGDTIPLWSYNENFGVWSKEGVATVYRNTDGKLAAKAEISHLSYWNLDWYYGTYIGNLSINFKPTNVTNNWYGYYSVVLQSPNGSPYASTSYMPQYDQYQQEYRYTYNYYWGYWPYFYNYYPWYSYSNYTIYGKYGFGMMRLPYTTQAKVVVYDVNNNYQKVGESNVFNPMTVGSINMNVTSPGPPDYVKVYFNMKGNCSNKRIDFLPSGWFYLYDYNNQEYTYVYIYDGKVYNYSTDNNSTTGQVTTGRNGVGGSIQMINGHRYYLETYTNGRWYSNNFSFRKSDFTIPSANGLSGVAKYSSSTNSMTIDGLVTINCN